MANEEQLSILKQGVDVWNNWRRSNPEIEIDLSGADLEGAKLLYADLRTVDFSQSNLRGAKLGRAKLSSSNLFHSNLSKAVLPFADLFNTDLTEAIMTEASAEMSDLSNAILIYADLSNTSFGGANFTRAKLTDTNLTNATLSEAIFFESVLIRTRFSSATFGRTIFSSIDLSKVIDIETTHHSGPSSLALDTLFNSKGLIPESFFRGCGLPDWEIESSKLYTPELSNEEINKILYKMYDLRATQALQISPLFISYSHADGAFVDKLDEHLNKKGVRFWRDVHDMRSGRMEKQIDRAMRLNPTVLVILSENSLQSDWVEHEVRLARSLEKEMKRDVLCPVAVDDSWKNGTWSKRIMEQVMEYNILDFSAWKDDSKFGGTFKKLIDGLELFYK